ncbi:MAG: hypothetical protein ACK50N_05060 [Flavobacteriales bacterium]
MDFLENCIQLMSPEEVKTFRIFIRSIKGADKKLQLFDLILKNKSDADLAEMLYKPVNRNAYHSLRKSLVTSLEEFFAHRSIITDEDNPSRTIAMGLFFLENADDAAAARFFQRAATLAEKRRDYALLDMIYSLMIEESVRLGTEMNDTILKWQQNSEKRMLDQRLKIAAGLIKKRLHEARISGLPLDPDATTKEIFTVIDLRDEAILIPDFMLRVVEMIRSAVISAKDYVRFESFILRVYKRLEEKNAFSKNDKTKPIFYYIIAHSLYRNRKFQESEKWLTKLESEHGLTIRAVQLRAATLTYLGRNEESITTIKSTIASKNKSITAQDLLNMHLNLAVYYFQSEDYKRAHQSIMKIGQTDTWLEKKMGKEWRFKKNMIEVIVHYELGNIDTAWNRINNMERYFEEFFKHPAYQRARIFMKFIKVLIANPERATAADFAKEVAQANMAWPDHKEDTQAMTFFCWLKSKMIRKPYYEVLLQAMNASKEAT